MNQNFLKQVTANEAWIYGYYIDRQKLNKFNQISRFSVFFDFNDVVHRKFLPYGQVIKKTKPGVEIHHNNAFVHVTCLCLFDKTTFTLLQPPY